MAAPSVNSTTIYNAHTIEEGWKQKERQRSSRRFALPSVSILLLRLLPFRDDVCKNGRWECHQRAARPDAADARDEVEVGLAWRKRCHDGLSKTRGCRATWGFLTCLLLLGTCGNYSKLSRLHCCRFLLLYPLIIGPFSGVLDDMSS